MHRHARPLALGALLSALLACTTSDPVTPPPAGAGTGADAGTGAAPNPVDASATSDAGAAGDVDAGPRVEGVVVSVPPTVSLDGGAVTVTIAPSTRPVDAALVSKTYELSPTGVTFDGDLEVCIETARRVGTHEVCLAYYDEASSRWTCEDSCLARKGDTNTLCGKTNHFTSFGVLLSGSGATAEGACESALVGPGGGAVVAPNGDAIATFGGGTLTKATRVTITRLPTTGRTLASPVFALTPNGSFPRDVEVCVRPDASAAAGGTCLGYLDESGSTPTWRCEDRCLTRRGDLLCGSTHHFTSFGVLLGGGASSASCADALIPPAGGTLTSLDGFASFEAGTGTFAEPTRVTLARAPSEARLGSDVYELLPDGLLAGKGKVCLRPSPGADLKAACLGFKDAAGTWKCEDTCLTPGPDGQLCGETSHFTSFGILLGGGTGTACQR